MALDQPDRPCPNCQRYIHRDDLQRAHNERCVLLPSPKRLVREYRKTTLTKADLAAKYSTAELTISTNLIANHLEQGGMPREEHNELQNGRVTRGGHSRGGLTTREATRWAILSRRCIRCGLLVTDQDDVPEHAPAAPEWFKPVRWRGKPRYDWEIKAPNNKSGWTNGMFNGELCGLCATKLNVAAVETLEKPFPKKKRKSKRRKETHTV